MFGVKGLRLFKGPHQIKIIFFLHIGLTCLGLRVSRAFQPSKDHLLIRLLYPSLGDDLFIYMLRTTWRVMGLSK